MAALLLQLPVNLLAEIAILATFEGPPSLFTHGLDQLGYVVSESRAGAGRQAQTERMVRTLEIVDVEPVVGDRAIGCPALGVRPGGGRPASARRSGDEKIEPRRFHLQAELQRRDSALLPDRAVLRLQSLGRLEWQFRRVAEPSQPLGRHAQFFPAVASIRLPRGPFHIRLSDPPASEIPHPKA